MGRIVAHVRISNVLEPDKAIECDALVDTGAGHMVLPKAWQERLGKLRTIRHIDCETATQALAAQWCALAARRGATTVSSATSSGLHSRTAS